MSSQGEWKPTAALLAATAVWGATFVTVKDALAAADSFTFLALRFGVGAIAAALLAWVLRRTHRSGGSVPSIPSEVEGRTSQGTSTGPLDSARGERDGGFALSINPLSVNRERGRVLVAGLGLGVLLYGGYALQTVGLETTTPARSAFITGLTVIFVPFVSWWLNGKRPPLRAFVAPVIALAGLQRLTGVTFSTAVPLGDVLTLGCAVVYAFHIVGMGKWGKNLPALELTAVQLALVCVLSIASLPFVERRFEPTPAFWMAVLFTGVIASAVAIAIQVWAQARINSTRAAMLFSLEPLFALGTAVVAGLGWPSAAELIGGGFILLAVLISEIDFSGFALRARGPVREG
jgi:drug/metabolite transporter (DMT)-like permease